MFRKLLIFFLFSFSIFQSEALGQLRLDSLDAKVKLFIKGQNRTTFFDWLTTNNRLMPSGIDTSGAIQGETLIFTGAGVSWDSAATGGTGGGATKYADEKTIKDSSNVLVVKDDGIKKAKLGDDVMGARDSSWFTAMIANRQVDINTYLSDMNIINAKSMGAIPDDGNDDTAYIQAAIDSQLQIGSAQVYLPNGTYDVSKLYIDGKYTHLIGNNAVMRPFNATGDTAIIIGNGVSQTWYTKVEGITFSTDGTDSFDVAISLRSAHFYHISKNVIYNCRTGIHIHDSYYGYIGDENRVYGCQTGIFLGEQSNIIVIENNTLSANVQSNIELSFAEAVTINGNSLEGARYGVLHDDYQVGGSYHPLQSVSIKNNYFENSSRGCIALGLNDQADRITIENNYINNNSTLDSAIIIGRTVKTRIENNHYTQNIKSVYPISIHKPAGWGYRTVIFTDNYVNDLPIAAYWKYVWVYHVPGNYYDYGDYTSDDINYVRNFLDQFFIQSGSGGYADPYRFVFDKHHRHITLQNDSLGYSINTSGGNTVRLMGGDTIPSLGTYNKGSFVFRSDSDSGKSVGWTCVRGGTFGTLSGVTASFTGQVTGTIAVNDASNLVPGQYITVAGRRTSEDASYYPNRITSIDTVGVDTIYVTPSVYMDAANPADSSVSYVPAIFIPFGQIGYRQASSSPNKRIRPHYLGEEYYNTADSSWYKAVNVSDSVWKKITN